MEKKFDFKTIAIACLLFFAFVFLIFYKFSSADDVVNHYLTASEIFSSQQAYEDFRGSLPEKIIPEWYSDSESMANLLDSIAAYAMGDYIQVSDNIVSELSGQITGDPDFLTHFLFDYDSLSWVFDSDTDDFIKSSLDPYIYESSDGPVVGNWYEVPHNYNGYFVNSSNPNVYTCIVQQGAYSYILTASYDYNASFTVGKGKYNGTIYHSVGGTCNLTYNGSYVVGYYTNNATYNSDPPSYMGATAYATRNEALADLFGWDGTSDGDSLIEGVSIRNEDFIVKPLSFPASVMVDYPNEITYPDYDPDDTRLTFEYTYNMDVPFWLKNPTTEPTSYELPTDYDFGNIVFEYDADPSYLAGAGIVQDVFDILPSSFQSLILLFGAGSLAFIFLRR